MVFSEVRKKLELCWLCCVKEERSFFGFLVVFCCFVSLECGFGGRDEFKSKEDGAC